MAFGTIRAHATVCPELRNQYKNKTKLNRDNNKLKNIQMYPRTVTFRQDN